MFYRGLSLVILLAPLVLAQAGEYTPFEGTDFFQNLDIDKNTVTEEKDVVFCVSDEGELKLDLFLPKPLQKSNPLLIIIHGGQFVSGHRKPHATEIARLAATHGFVAASVDYGLASTPNYIKDGSENDSLQIMATLPQPIHDVQCAVRWLKGNFEKYQIKANRVGVLGIGAGGYIATMLALGTGSGKASHRADLNDKFKTIPDSIQVAVNWGGPVSMTNQFHYENQKSKRNLAALVTASTPTEEPTRFQSFDPIFKIEPTAAPILSFHGTQDKIYPFSSAVRFDQEMNRKGAYHSLVPIPGAGHGFKDKDGALNTELMTEILTSTLEFFTLTLKAEL